MIFALPFFWSGSLIYLTTNILSPLNHVCMSIQLEIKYCTYCDKQIKGRSDKKFCNDFCRSGYHYEINRSTSTLVHAINLNLRRNRKILQSFIPATFEKTEVERDNLLVYGFTFMYFTHMKVISDITYYFCYDLGYHMISRDTIAIVQQKSLVETIKAWQSSSFLIYGHILINDSVNIYTDT